MKAYKPTAAQDLKMTLEAFVFSIKDYQVMEEITLAAIKDLANG